MLLGGHKAVEGGGDAAERLGSFEALATLL